MQTFCPGKFKLQNVLNYKCFFCCFFSPAQNFLFNEICTQLKMQNIKRDSNCCQQSVTHKNVKIQFFGGEGFSKFLALLTCTQRPPGHALDTPLMESNSCWEEGPLVTLLGAPGMQQSVSEGTKPNLT